ncbi:MAG: hypothetical protein ACRET8_06915 [Burkholderiales bacterium]
MRYLVQSFIALALLIGLPMVMESPESTEGILVAVAGALVLVAFAVRGVVRFVRSRKTRTFHDSIMPDRAVPPKVTVMEKPKE